MPARERCSSTVQGDPTMGSGRRKTSQTTEKYEPGGQRQRHDFLNVDRTDRETLDSERVQYQRGGPPGQLLHQ